MRRKVGRAEAPAGAEAEAESQASLEPQVDDSAALKKELAELRKKDKERETAAKLAERAKLGELERLAAERDEIKAERDSLAGELGSLRKSKRLDTFQSEVAKLAPDVPAKRLRALLKDLEEDGVDIAPEQASPALAKKALDMLRANDPDSFKPKGNPPPGPGQLRTYEPGPIDWRERGAKVAGRGKAKKPATQTRNRKLKGKR